MRQKLLLPLPPIDQTYFESRLYQKDISSIAGVDEVGRGSLAGPVLAASVILPRGCQIAGVDDSKRLSPSRREGLYDVILSSAVAYGIGIISPEEIDEINILKASIKAMKIAVESLAVRPQYLLIDGNQPLDIDIPQQIIEKGDVRSISVGAASIIAKVTRDRMMARLEESYPNFRFSVHKGYGTKMHLSELKSHGPTPIHRRTFAGVKEGAALA